jgi:hypothetical protein
MSIRFLLKTWCDSVWAGDVDGRKSRTWFLLPSDNSAICWQLMKQRIVAMSSYEVEYVDAIAVASCQVV